MQRSIERLARLSAILGGGVLLGLVAITCLSILGRALNTLAHRGLPGTVLEPLGNLLIALGAGPVRGDFELVEAGIGFAVFAFLPLCQLRAGHASVDLFTAGLPRPVNRALLAFWEAVFAAAMVLIGWRLYEGMLTKLSNGETTFLLQYPVWWVYAACLLPAAIAVIVALWSAWDRLRAALTQRDTRPVDGGPSP